MNGLDMVLYLIAAAFLVDAVRLAIQGKRRRQRIYAEVKRIEAETARLRRQHT